MTQRLSQCLNIAWKVYFYLLFLQHHKTTQKSPKILKITDSDQVSEKIGDHFKTEQISEECILMLQS